MDEDLYTVFITDHLGLPEDSLLQFYIMTLGMGTPKLGHIQFDHFKHLFEFAKVQTMTELKKAVPRLEKDMHEPKTYEEMYKQLYEAFLVKNLSMDFEYAESLWGVLLKDFKLGKEFGEYLEHLGPKKPLKCHKDLWMMMYEFAQVVRNIEKDYSEGDAWPVFLDNFAEFVREKNAK